MNEFHQGSQFISCHLESGAVPGLDEELSSGTSTFLDSIGFSSDCSTTRYDSVTHKWDTTDATESLSEPCWFDILRTTPTSQLNPSSELDETKKVFNGECVENIYIPQPADDLYVPKNLCPQPLLDHITDNDGEALQSRHPANSISMFDDGGASENAVSSDPRAATGDKLDNQPMPRKRRRALSAKARLWLQDEEARSFAAPHRLYFALDAEDQQYAAVSSISANPKGLYFVLHRKDTTVRTGNKPRTGTKPSGGRASRGHSSGHRPRRQPPHAWIRPARRRRGVGRFLAAQKADSSRRAAAAASDAPAEARTLRRRG